MGLVVAQGSALLISSSPPVRLPLPSAEKLPARKNAPDEFIPETEKANCPWNEDVEYPEIVTVALATDGGKSCDDAVTVTVEPIGGVFGAV